MATVSHASNQDRATADKLAALRKAMNAVQHQALDAYLIPSVDEHINEYLPDNKQRRAWVSNFTGSAGDLLVAQTEAWIFADSRYHEQADTEVDLNHIRVSKLGLEGQPSLIEKIKELANGKSGFRLGFDPFTLTVQQYQVFHKAFDQSGVQLVSVPGNLVDPLWTDRPADPREPVRAVPTEVAGQSWPDKLRQVQAKLKALKADVLPITKLDQIAWLFNLRGQDIPYNPLFIAYALITPDSASLFTDTSRIPENIQANLKQAGVQLKPYEAYAEAFGSELIRHVEVAMETGIHSMSTKVLIDPKHTTKGTLDLAQAQGAAIIEAEHPVELMKAIKNETEIRHMQAANLKASRGKIRAWYWLEQQLQKGQTVTEETFKDAIESFYAEENGFAGLSFNTISGAGKNSSIVHYGTPDPHKKLEAGELFLIDSGCQFLDDQGTGTTDDTRTMLIGDTPTPEQKIRYTEVLKAHINCAMQQFPKGTEGARLDGICRATLWQNGLDYGHGTGHGVGAFLNVHEGPNGIHKLAAKPLEPGMINSIEPGFYEPGWGGIRLENLYRVIELEPGPNGAKWLGFESLTYIPFDKKLIDLDRLSPEQLQWLRDYYAAILDKVTLPTKEETAWLEALCTL